MEDTMRGKADTFVRPDPRTMTEEAAPLNERQAAKSVPLVVEYRKFKLAARRRNSGEPVIAC